MTASADMVDQNVIAAQLRDLDRDSYLASLVLPQQSRAAIQTLYAFAGELAAIRHRVSEPMPGEIRLQFWHDALEGEGHGDVDGNPLAKALFATLKTHQLSTVPLLRMVAARRFDLYQDPMPDQNQFEGYAGEVASINLQYAAQICAGEAAEPELFNDAAGHLGVALTYLRALYSFEYDRRRAQIFLPLSIFHAFGLGDKDILAATKKNELVAALSACAEEARNHLSKASTAIHRLPNSAKSAFAVMPIVQADINRMQAALKSGDWHAVKMSDWRKILQILLWGLRN